VSKQVLLILDASTLFRLVILMLIRLSSVGGTKCLWVLCWQWLSVQVTADWRFRCWKVMLVASICGMCLSLLWVFHNYCKCDKAWLVLGVRNWGNHFLGSFYATDFMVSLRLYRDWSFYSLQFGKWYLCYDVRKLNIFLLHRNWQVINLCFFAIIRSLRYMGIDISGSNGDLFLALWFLLVCCML